WLSIFVFPAIIYSIYHRINSFGETINKDESFKNICRDNFTFPTSTENNIVKIFLNSIIVIIAFYVSLSNLQDRINSNNSIKYGVDFGTNNILAISNFLDIIFYLLWTVIVIYVCHIYIELIYKISYMLTHSTTYFKFELENKTSKSKIQYYLKYLPYLIYGWILNKPNIIGEKLGGSTIKDNNNLNCVQIRDGFDEVTKLIYFINYRASILIVIFIITYYTEIAIGNWIIESDQSTQFVIGIILGTSFFLISTALLLHNLETGLIKLRDKEVKEENDFVKIYIYNNMKGMYVSSYKLAKSLIPILFAFYSNKNAVSIFIIFDLIS
ncbi:MAG: hypothetical protein OEY49_18480, partial [Candidatus Heimdallarchaeota archaeon]|nr:hypothetical protein [Candidatus Heimdallarchaeota archaeon]